MTLNDNKNLTIFFHFKLVANIFNENVIYHAHEFFYVERSISERHTRNDEISEGRKITIKAYIDLFVEVLLSSRRRSEVISNLMGQVKC